MKSVLLPTDFSDNARNAIVFILNLLKGVDVEYFMVHTYDPPSSGGMLISVDDIIKKDAENSLLEEAEWFDSVNFSNSKLTTGVHFGQIGHIVNELVNEYNIDLIGMGTNGASGLQEMVFGSNTANVIENSTIPVLAIPEGRTMQEFKHILFPVDFNYPESIGIINSAKEALALFKCELDIIYVNENPDSDTSYIDDYKNELQASLTDLEYKITVINNDDVLDTIQSYIHAKNPDLVITIPQEYGFIEQLFHKSVTETLVSESNAPLLSIK